MPVTAAGNGTIRYSAETGGGYGQKISIEHGDYVWSLYAHLDKLMLFTGRSVCRYVIIAYAGNTSNRVMDPHLHFESKPGAFGPIYGNRSTGSRYTTSDFSTDGWTAHHSCGPGGCAEDTSAYTVDDSQNPSRCSTCATEFDESSNSATGEHDWDRVASGGIGYGVKAEASYYHTFMQAPGDPPPVLQTVVWAPHLHYAGMYSIYAYIPDRGTDHESTVTPVAWYRIEQCDELGACSTVVSATAILQSSRNKKGTWVKVHSGSIRALWADPANSGSPIRVTLDNHIVPSGLCANGACEDKLVLADAMLFIPNECQ